MRLVLKIWLDASLWITLLTQIDALVARQEMKTDVRVDSGAFNIKLSIRKHADEDDTAHIFIGYCNNRLKLKGTKKITRDQWRRRLFLQQHIMSRRLIRSSGRAISVVGLLTLVAKLDGNQMKKRLTEAAI